MKNKIKELRVNIDGLAQLTKGIFNVEVKSINWRLHVSKEVENSIDSLLMAKSWLGKIYIILGVESTPDQADQHLPDFLADEKGHSWKELNHIEKVIWLRHEISEIIKKLPDYDEFYGKASDEAKRSISYEKREVGFDKLKPLLDAIPDWSIEIQNVFTNLTEAMFNLEFELQRINES